MKRKFGEVNNEEQPKKHPAYLITSESTTHPHFKATQEILDSIEADN